MTQYPETDRTTLHRKRERGSHEKDVIHDILDEAFMASVAISIDGKPHVQPMLIARDGEKLILHGSAQNRLLNHLREGHEACINVTLMDGLIFGPTIPDHSANYRSVTIYGQATEVTGLESKRRAMKRVFDSLIANRWTELPALDENYLEQATIVFEIPIDESVAKIQERRPTDFECDDVQIWTGILPFQLTYGPPLSSSEQSGTVPAGVASYKRPQNR